MCSTLGSGKGMQAKRVKDAYEFYHENLDFARTVSLTLSACRYLATLTPGCQQGLLVGSLQPHVPWMMETY
jgi:hypothetical protein